MGLSNDLPIDKPSEDRFGLDPFAAALAASITGMQAASGMVLAVNGAWGSGKSSAINLIQHHLRTAVEREKIALVPFNPWWFTGADTLTLAFFAELNKAIGPSLSDNAKKSLAKLGQGVSSVGAMVGAIADMKAPGLGAIISGAAGLVGKLTDNSKTVDQEHRLVADALQKQKKRFLVIIDDIDRLSPDDALTIFRLVKSVGRLPNVIYLLAFDRQIAERIVSERFPSEGPSYLEKIVQGAFDIPPPVVDVLRQQVLETAVGIMGEPAEAQVVRFMNVFYDVVAPTIRTPRDVARLGNQLSTTWPAIAGNVDRADFLAITAIQLAMPAVYNTIRENPELLCGSREQRDQRQQDLVQEYEAMFGMANMAERERSRLRVALRRLFPRLDSVWGNMWHSSGDSWRKSRLIAAPEHFRSYFAFSISEDVVPAEVIEELVAKADDTTFVQETFRKALSTQRRTGATQAALLLEELNVHSFDVSAEKVAALTATLFAMADDLDVKNDVEKGFLSMGNNQLRLHWLFNRLVTDRFEMEERDRIYAPAMEGASLAWACSFAERCSRYYQPSDDDERERGAPIVSEAVAQRFNEMALAGIQAAANTGGLIQHPRPKRLLFCWIRLSAEGVAEVRRWTDQALDDPDFVVAMAKEIPSESHSHGMGFDEMGDRVSRRTVLVNLRDYADLLDTTRLEARVAELIETGALSDEQREVLTTFRDLPRGSHGGGED